MLTPSLACRWRFPEQEMYTGPAVLQLVTKGVIGLNDPITMHVDPLLLKLNGTTLEDTLGPRIHEVQIWHLLHM
jgi:CubicO group peptidase (beta-lactamase class C family)